jgi:hypothetical protein
MFNVACFCGCCYSFSDGAGACPRCGKTAVVSVPLPGPGTGRQPAGPEMLVLTDGQRTLVLTDVSCDRRGKLVYSQQQLAAWLECRGRPRDL